MTQIQHLMINDQANGSSRLKLDLNLGDRLTTGIVTGVKWIKQM